MKEDEKFKRYIVRSFDDLLEVIKKIKSKEFKIWYRGRADANNQLIPSAMRKNGRSSRSVWERN